MSEEIRRQEPSLAGGGAGQQLGSAARSGRQAAWVASISDDYIEGLGFMARGARINGMQKWLEVWQELQFFWTDRVDTFQMAREQLARTSFDVRTMLSDMLAVWRDLIEEGRGSSAQAAAFVEEVKVRFRAESADFLREMDAELAYFLSHAGHLDEAVEICERLIAEHPGEARGYLALADIYLGEGAAELERAADVLQRALDYPVEGADELELLGRIEELRALFPRAKS